MSSACLLLPVILALAAPARDADFARFDDFLARLRATPAPGQATLSRDYVAWQTTHGGFPVPEKDAVVFVYLRTGAEKEVRVRGEFMLRNFNTVLWDERGEPLAEAGGVFFRRMPIEADARLEYQLLVDGRPLNDPLNPRTFINGAVPGAGKDGIPVSELMMPGYRAHALATTRPGSRSGRTLTLDEPWASPRVTIHLPPGYNPARRYPTLYVADGSTWARIIGLPVILDNLTTDGAITPVIAVLIDPTDDRSGWYAFRSPYLAYLEKVVSWVDGHFSTQASAASRLHVGSSAGGRAGLAVVLERPDLFANTALFSPSLVAPPHIYEPYLAGRKRPDPRQRVWLSAGSYEAYLLEDARMLERYLRTSGIALETAYTHDGHSMGAWRTLLPRALSFFFPRRPK